MSAHGPPWARRLIDAVCERGWVRFGLVGVGATITYAVLALLLERGGVPVLAGNALAYAAGFGVSYTGHRLWSFQSQTAHTRALPRFAVAQAMGLGLNTLIIAALMRLGLSYAQSVPAAVVAVPAAVYFISKHWAFREPAPSAGRNGRSGP